MNYPPVFDTLKPVCKDDPNSERCVTPIEAISLHIEGRSLGMRHNFSGGDESSPPVFDTLKP